MRTESGEMAIAAGLGNAGMHSCKTQAIATNEKTDTATFTQMAPVGKVNLAIKVKFFP